MNPLARLQRGTRWVFLFGATFAAMAGAADAPQLAYHLVFDRDSRGELRCRNTISGETLAVSGGAWSRGAAEFGGSPRQGIPLGVLSFTQPLTVMFWLQRANEPVAHPEGRNLPEYSQEHERRQGRLLGAARGNPAESSGSLRIGPDKLEVWHAKSRWNVVIAGPIPAGRWIHVAVTYGADLRATGYLNGERKGTAPSACDFHGNPVAIAAPALERKFGYPFAGRMGEVRIYRGMVPAEEIAALAARPPAD